MRTAGLVAAIVAVAALFAACSQRSLAAGRTDAGVGAPDDPPIAASAVHTAGGETAAPRIEVGLGFAGRCRPGFWAPLRAVGTAGAGGIRGRLKVVVPGDRHISGSGWATTYVLPLALPPYSAFDARLVVPIEERTAPIEVLLEEGGVVLAREVVRAQQLRAGEALMLFAAGYARRPPPGLASLAPAFAMCEVEPRHLPEEPLAYDGVAAVVLALSSTSDMSDAQVAALRSWTRQGGRLVILGGPGLPAPLPPLMRDVLPVEIEGETAASGFNMLSNRYGGGLAAGVPAVLIASNARSGASVLADEAGLPLVVSGREGAGEVVFCAFDPSSAPFSAWAGLGQLWKELVPREGDGRISGLKDIVGSVLVTTKPLYPGIGPLLVFSGVYLLAVFATVVALRRSGRVQCAFAVAMCSVAAVFSLVAWNTVVPLARRFNTAVSRVTVIECQNRSETARLQTLEGILPSSDEVADLAFKTPDWWIAGCGLPARAYRGRELEVVRARGTSSVRDLGLPAGEMTLLRAEAIMPFALGASLERTQDGLSLAVKNHTGLQLEDAALLIGERAARLGPIPNDAVASFALSGPSGFSDAVPELKSVRPGTGRAVWTKAQAGLMQALIDQLVVPHFVRGGRQGGTRAGASPPVLVAWTPGRESGVAESRLVAHRTEVGLVILYLWDLDAREVGLTW